MFFKNKIIKYNPIYNYTVIVKAKMLHRYQIWRWISNQTRMGYYGTLLHRALNVILFFNPLYLFCLMSKYNVVFSLNTHQTTVKTLYSLYGTDKNTVFPLRYRKSTVFPLRYRKTLYSRWGTEKQSIPSEVLEKTLYSL